MALTRARVVAGDAGFAAAIAGEIEAILACPRDRAKVMTEAVEMRAMIEKEKPPRDLWDIKLIPGGLIDLEFIAQVAVLTGGVAAQRKADRHGEILAHLAPGFADAQVRQELGGRLFALFRLDPDHEALPDRSVRTGRCAARPVRSAAAADRPARFRRAGGAPQGDGAEGPKAISTFCFVRSAGDGDGTPPLGLRNASGVTMQQEKTMKTSTRIALAFLALAGVAGTAAYAATTSPAVTARGPA